MDLNRREFLKLTGASTMGVLVLAPLKFEKGAGPGAPTIVLKKKVKETTTTCPFCGCGCGFIVASDNGQVTNIEGDPDHPVNKGAACAKGASMRQLAADNPRRLSKVRYRAPGASDWEEKSWDWAMDRIASLVKKTRDQNWKAKDGDFVVNRTEAVASLGGAALDNEECYVLTKMSRALGLVYLEHQARI
jgi:formate dehydrogenase major subunit